MLGHFITLDALHAEQSESKHIQLLSAYQNVMILKTIQIDNSIVGAEICCYFLR